MIKKEQLETSGGNVKLCQNAEVWLPRSAVQLSPWKATEVLRHGKPENMGLLGWLGKPLGNVKMVGMVGGSIFFGNQMRFPR